jgi:hypothetical protein
MAKKYGLIVTDCALALGRQGSDTHGGRPGARGRPLRDLPVGLLASVNNPD